MTAPAHERLQDRAAAYVLGALPPSERAEFEAHVRECNACAAEVRSLGPAANALALAVPAVDPPPALRARLLRAVTGSAPPEALPFARPARPSRSAGLAWLTAAAASLAAVALGAYAAMLRADLTRLDARLQEATERALVAERQVAEVRRAVDRAESTTAILAAPDLARVDLAGQAAAPDARARAFWSRTRGLVFTVSNLPPPPAGRTYQLWVITAQPQPISAGLLTPDPSGRVTAVFDTPPDIPQPVAMAVTIEPEGGVPAPTGDKVLVGMAGAAGL